jgi:hypothetical protein
MATYNVVLSAAAAAAASAVDDPVASAVDGPVASAVDGPATPTASEKGDVGGDALTEPERRRPVSPAASLTEPERRRPVPLATSLTEPERLRLVPPPPYSAVAGGVLTVRFGCGDRKSRLGTTPKFKICASAAAYGCASG